MDEEFCGIRGGYFVIEYGSCDEYTGEPETYPDVPNPSILVTGNHLGLRRMVWFPVRDRNVIRFFEAVWETEPVERLAEDYQCMK